MMHCWSAGRTVSTRRLRDSEGTIFARAFTVAIRNETGRFGEARIFFPWQQYQGKGGVQVSYTIMCKAFI